MPVHPTTRNKRSAISQTVSAAGNENTIVKKWLKTPTTVRHVPTAERSGGRTIPIINVSIGRVMKPVNGRSQLQQ